MLVHGGPGRAGGGEEMGGARGVKHYMQRAAIQGSPDSLTAITSVYQAHAEQKLEEKHPFRKYFEELEIGDSVHTAPGKLQMKISAGFRISAGTIFMRTWKMVLLKIPCLKNGLPMGILYLVRQPDYL